MPAIKWSDTFYVKAYELARSGFSDVQIAAVCGVSPQMLRRWKHSRPAFLDAFQRGRTAFKGRRAPGFRDYVFSQLSPHLHKVWDRLAAFWNEPNGVRKVEALLDQHGAKVRQHLFLYALTAGNFDFSKALKQVNISRSTLNRWVRTDPDFTALLDEINWHKGNFFEDALVKLVDEGDTHAVLFANRTYNRDRGYSDKQQVELSGPVTDRGMDVIDFDSLDIPLSARKAILKAIEANESGTQNAAIRSGRDF